MPGRVRLDLAQPRGVEPPQPRHAVGDPAPLELVEPGQLVLAERDDQLPARVVADPALLAVGAQLAHPLDAQPRLERAGHVVDPGVDDARVVAGLVRADAVLALEHDDPPPGVAPPELARHREPEDAAADDRDVRRGGHPARWTISPSTTVRRTGTSGSSSGGQSTGSAPRPVRSARSPAAIRPPSAASPTIRAASVV